MADSPPNLSKPMLEFMNFEHLPWTEVGEGTTKAKIKTLADDHRTGDSSFILHLPCNYRSKSNEGISHDFWEEVLILDGDLTDLRLSKTFGVHHYACRPPGMIHGP